MTDDNSLDLWTRNAPVLNSLGLLEVLDATTFAMLCEAFAAWLDMRAEFQRDGEYTIGVGENGAVQQNPLCQMIAQQSKAVLALASEFGMTPISRQRLTGSTSCIPEGTNINPMEQLLQEALARPAASPATQAQKKPTKRKSPRKKPAKKAKKA